MAFDQEPQTLGKEIDAHLETHPETIKMTQSVTVAPQASEFVTITGFEGIPVASLGMPRVKLVQGTSQNVELATGNEATPGSFFYTDSKTSKNTVRMAIISTKRGFQEFENNGEVKKVERIAILFKDMEDNKMYLTDLSVTSFKSFNELVGMAQAEEWEHAWSKEVLMTSDKVEGENSKGEKVKYYTVKLSAGETLNEDESLAVFELWKVYGGYFTREEDQEVI